MNVTEARAFIRVCIYYRIWIKSFSIITEPIYYLLLKAVLTNVLVLVRIIYSDGVEEIILAVDTSLIG